MSKGILEYVPPLTLLVVQLAASLAFLWTAVLAGRVPLALRQETWRLGLAGLLNPGLAYTFGLLGLALTSASMSSLIWAAEPVLILILAWLILRERLTFPLVALSALALSGALLVVGSGANANSSGMMTGNVLVATAVFCCAIYTILTRRSAEKVDPVLLTAVQQSFSLVWALAIWPVGLRDGELATLATLPASIWVWAAAAGVVYYALAFWFYIIGLRQASASLAGLFLNLIPVFGVGGAFLFLGERLQATQWLGAFVILAAVTGISRLSATAVIAAPTVVEPPQATSD